MRSAGGETCQLLRDTFQSVKGEDWPGTVNATQLPVDRIPKRGGVQWVGTHHRGQPQSSESFGPQDLLF